MANGTLARENARRKFLAWITDNGYTLTKPFGWVGTQTKYAATCSAGHETLINPSSASQNVGGCKVCGSARSAEAKSTRARAAFLSWADETGYKFAEPFEWRGSYKPCAATCPEGHECAPVPSKVQQGRTGCATCGRARPQREKSDAARDKFRAWADDNGYVLAESFEWRGTKVRYEAVCPTGHECALWPDNAMNKGRGCNACGSLVGGAKKTATARDRFLAWISDNGYTLTEPFEWHGLYVPCPATCPEGHKCGPNPANVSQGGGGCPSCSHALKDVFYVVYNPRLDNIKFGISSGDPRDRLGFHKRDGYSDVLRTFTALPEGTAKELEDELKLQMKCAGVAPVQGREYFPGAARNVILGFVDEWLRP